MDSRHEDKYSALAPQRPRGCRTSNGLAKRTLSKSKARKVAAKLAAKEHHAMSVYYCDDCFGYHIGNYNPAARREGDILVGPISG